MKEQIKKRNSTHRFVPDPEGAYLSRCTKTLKAMGLSLGGWRCADVIDVRAEEPDVPLETCDICGCSKVRYVHIMEHPDTGLSLSVGCICAGVMEGDIFGARERERQMKNRASRRRTFVRKPWETGIFDGMLFQKGSIVYMNAVGQDSDQSPQYHVFVDDAVISEYKGKPICDPLTAKYAAFDVLDPIDQTEVQSTKRQEEQRNSTEKGQVNYDYTE